MMKHSDDDYLDYQDEPVLIQNIQALALTHDHQVKIFMFGDTGLIYLNEYLLKNANFLFETFYLSIYYYWSGTHNYKHRARVGRGRLSISLFVGLYNVQSAPQFTPISLCHNHSPITTSKVVFNTKYISIIE